MHLIKSIFAHMVILSQMQNLLVFVYTLKDYLPQKIEILKCFSQLRKNDKEVEAEKDSFFSF